MTLTPEDIAAGWVEWGGGRRVLEKSVTVRIRYRPFDDEPPEGQEAGQVYLAGDVLWRHDGSGGDIIAYRIITPPLDKETP